MDTASDIARDIQAIDAVEIRHNKRFKRRVRREYKAQRQQAHDAMLEAYARAQYRRRHKEGEK